jgi:uncharacterized membrane protein YcfT
MSLQLVELAAAEQNRVVYSFLLGWLNYGDNSLSLLSIMCRMHSRTQPHLRMHALRHAFTHALSHALFQFQPKQLNNLLVSRKIISQLLQCQGLVLIL